ncbi:hypothetical protein [Curtobacterium sp. MCPF17_052]|uniref:hypothetical protein n=1 Tax=Curtobacterium sp. MCPF17_052 TaxID=2175655 RepID=UPI0024DFB946|nr:hypothetical protein [Curtobacterium sp. MCPF17_052]WIB12983.1 hypothetical protein DEJ36_03025 [Curtobacterium sp. MCPF17_052]
MMPSGGVGDAPLAVLADELERQRRGRRADRLGVLAVGVHRGTRGERVGEFLVADAFDLTVALPDGDALPRVPLLREAAAEELAGDGVVVLRAGGGVDELRQQVGLVRPVLGAGRTVVHTAGGGLVGDRLPGAHGTTGGDRRAGGGAEQRHGGERGGEHQPEARTVGRSGRPGHAGSSVPVGPA